MFLKLSIPLIAGTRQAGLTEGMGCPRLPGRVPGAEEDGDGMRSAHLMSGQGWASPCPMLRGVASSPTKRRGPPVWDDRDDFLQRSQEL